MSLAPTTDNGATDDPVDDPLAESTHEVSVVVNGRVRSATVPARRLLSDFLRHDLGLTGTHVGCEHGVCGCCTVLLEGEAVRACLLLAVGVDGMEVTTVEGLASLDGDLHPVQQAYHDEHGLQCGFCTPGMVMSTCEFLARNPEPTRDEVREGISGNLCRCTGYENIVDAVEAAARLVRDSGLDPRQRCAGSTGSDVGSGAVSRSRLGATPNVSGTSGRGPHGQGGSADDREAAHAAQAAGEIPPSAADLAERDGRDDDPDPVGDTTPSDDDAEAGGTA